MLHRGPIRRLRIEEVCFQGRSCPGAQAGGFLHDDAGVLPADGAAFQGIKRRGQRGGQRMGFAKQGRRRAFTDGEHARDFRHQAHLLR